MFKLINRFRFLYVFIILILFFLFKAINEQLGWFKLADILFAVIIFSGLLIIGHRERLLSSLISMLIVLIIGLHLLEFYFSITVITGMRLLISIGFLILLTSYCLYLTAQDKTISVTTLFGPISSYLFIGLIFANIYLFIELLFPNSFTGLNSENESKAIYFSFITLTTVGYGEIIPLKPIAQTFTWFESFSGQLYIAIIIGQLIGRYSSEKQSRKTA